MELRLQRLPAIGSALMGDMLTDSGGHFCTLENAEQQIPRGRYRVAMTVSSRCCAGHLWSPRTDHALPLIEGVPGRTGIRIHGGTFWSDFEGCIGVAQGKSGDRLVNSHLALSFLMDQMEAAKTAIWLEVFDAKVPVAKK